MTHICVSKLTIIGSDNGLSTERCQAIIWTNAGILLIWPLGTKFSEISIDINTFSLKKIHFKMSSGKCRPFCLGLNVLRNPYKWIMCESSDGCWSTLKIHGCLWSTRQDSKYLLHLIVNIFQGLTNIRSYPYKSVGSYISLCNQPSPFNARHALVLTLLQKLAFPGKVERQCGFWDTILTDN